MKLFYNNGGAIDLGQCDSKEDIQMANRDVKICWATPIISEMPGSATPDPSKRSVVKEKEKRTNVGEDVEEKELSYIADGNVSWCGDYERRYGGSLRN